MYNKRLQHSTSSPLIVLGFDILLSLSLRFKYINVLFLLSQEKWIK